MGKIRTEGVGEVQEFVDIVSEMMSPPILSLSNERTLAEGTRASLSFLPVRLCCWTLEDDERKSDQL